MTSDQLDRVKEALLALADLAPAEQTDWIASRLSADPAVRAEVESLLAASRRSAPTFLAPVALDDAEPGLREPAPRRVGRYQIEGVLGRGAMGRVYRARQTSPVSRLVALKLVDPLIASPAMLERFREEQRAIAALTHPNIAALLDAGIGDDGTPYVAMELVDGPNILEHARAQRLDARAVIALGIQTARGLHHAHLRGVLHRDIKPSNILIATSEQQACAKIIDFGVARMLNDDSGRARATMQGQIVGTIEYMSPEQADPVRPDVDVRSDVYALGVVLYETLTGLLPHDAAAYRAGGLDGALRLLRAGDAPRPSARAKGPGGSGMDLPADLDCVVLKAIEPDRDHRFGSARELADDLQRILDGLPISARPPTAAYRAAQFVRRNRLAVAAGASVLAALVAGTVGTTIGLIQAGRREAALQRSLAESDAVGEYLRSLLVGGTLRNLGPDAKMRDVIKRLADEFLRDTNTSGIVRARVADALSQSLVDLDEPALATRVATSGLDALGDPRIQTEAQIAASILNRLALIRIEAGDAAGARPLLERADTTLAPFPDSRDALGVEVKCNLTGVVDELGDTGRAAALLEALRSDPALVPPGTDAARAIDINLAIIYVRGGRFADARILSERVYADRRTLPRDEPTRVNAARILAEALARTGDPDAATALLDEHIDPQAAADPARRVAQFLLELSRFRIQSAAGDPGAPGRIRELISAHPEGTIGPKQRAFAQASLAAAEIQAGTQTADQTAAAAIADITQAFGPAHPDLARAHATLARAYLQAGRPDQARPHAQAAKDFFTAHATVRTPLMDEIERMLDPDPAPKP